MNYLKVFVDFEEVIEPLSDEERGRLFLAMLRYAKDGTVPSFDGNERFVWATARQGIDREEEFCRQKRENGSHGGRPRKNQEEPKETKENQEKPSESKKTYKDNDNDNDKDKDKDKESKRHKYGEYKNVLLSDEELEKLKAEFPDYLQRIERLSEYIAKTGKSYKSHLATIRSWARSEKKEPEKPQKEWMRRYIGGTK